MDAPIAGQSAPIAAAPQAAPAAPVVMESTPQYVAPPQAGMPSSPAAAPNKTLDFFREINWFEVGIMFLGVLAMYKTIDYYTFKKKEDKTTYYDVQRQLDKLGQRTTENESNMAGIVQLLDGGGSSNGMRPEF